MICTFSTQDILSFVVNVLMNALSQIQKHDCLFVQTPTGVRRCLKPELQNSVRCLNSDSSFQNISKKMFSFPVPEPEKWVERYRKPPMVTDRGPLFRRF